MGKVLIIEDDMGIYELERDYLEIEGFEVDIETNGIDGLNRALNNEYDLILLDIMIPKRMDLLFVVIFVKKKKFPLSWLVLSEKILIRYEA